MSIDENSAAYNFVAANPNAGSEPNLLEKVNMWLEDKYKRYFKGVAEFTAWAQRVLSIIRMLSSKGD